MFPGQKSYRALFEPISKSRLKGWDHSRKLNCDSSFTINLSTCHKAKMSWNMHITEMFYILYMMISQKPIIFVSKIVTHSCSGVLASSVLSLVSPITTDKAKCCFYLTTVLREKSPSSMQLSQFLFYLCSRSCSCFGFLWATQVTISTHSQPTMQQVWQSTSQVLHSRQPPHGGITGTLLPYSSTGDLFIKQSLWQENLE